MLSVNKLNERVFRAGDIEVIEIKRGSVYRVSGAYGSGSHYYHPETDTVRRAFTGTVVRPFTAMGDPNTEYVSVRSTALDAVGEFENSAPVVVEVTTAELSKVVSRFEIDPVDFARVMEVALDQATTEAIYDYGISYTNPDVVEDSPEGVSEYRGHDFL